MFFTFHKESFKVLSHTAIKTEEYRRQIRGWIKENEGSGREFRIEG